jgi:processing peptidase subunit alpha
MLRQVAARLQPRARAQGSRLLSTQSRFGAVKPLVPRRTMATVHIEGIHKVSNLEHIVYPIGERRAK